MTERWRIRLTGPAHRDFADILRWTRTNFGAQQAQAYRELLLAALAALGDGPDIPGSKLRGDILQGARTLHIQRPGRHFLLYRPAEGNSLEILRILHDAMDLARHVPSGDP